MSNISVNSRLLGLKDVQVHVEDSGGNGRPVVLIHGWPLSSASWNEQFPALEAAGYRAVAYDRRGFGQSDKPSSGYDYDTFAEDLNGLLTEMDLNDVTLVGFSMGGGEVARYISKYGEDRLHSVVFASAVPPMMIKTDDNPNGPLNEAKATEMTEALTNDEASFYDGFSKQFFSPNGDGNIQVSEDVRLAAVEMTKLADKTASLEAMKAFAMTDFRGDLTKITVPTLVIHGEADGIVPFMGSGKLTNEAVAHSELHVVANGCHGINASHADEFNSTLIDFLSK